MNKNFLYFLKMMESSDPAIIQAITEAYTLIESLSTDDANRQDINSGDTVPMGAVSYEQNPEEYFPKSNYDEMAKKAQFGYRVAKMPEPGRTTLNRDPATNQLNGNISAVGK